MTSITFAGHSAVLVEINQKIVAIDPWLRGNPACPADLTDPAAIDFIVLTHGHADHASDTLRLANKYDCSVLATYELAMILIQQGIPEAKVIPMNKGGTVEIQGISFTLTHALHSNSFDCETGTLYAGEACGVVLQGAGTRLYHAGDTALFSDMKLIAEQYSPTIGLLPIGDRFTMGPAEAARAARLLGLETVIPIHFNTFPLLTGTAEEFQNELKNDNVSVVVLEPGQTHTCS